LAARQDKSAIWGPCDAVQCAKIGSITVHKLFSDGVDDPQAPIFRYCGDKFGVRREHKVYDAPARNLPVADRVLGGLVFVGLATWREGTAYSNWMPRRHRHINTIERIPFSLRRCPVW